MHSNPTGDDTEEEANRFAAEFLTPADDIAHQLDNLTIEKAASLKQHWKVSMAAIVKRAQDLRRITPNRTKTLFSYLSAQGYRLNEPFPIPTEEPQVVRQLVAVHRQQLGYDDFDLAKLLFSPDPQFFAPGYSPSILKLNGQPFFAFFPESRPRLFPRTGGGTP